MSHKLLFVVCEGQVEETFVRNVLAPYLPNVQAVPRLVGCSGKSKQGGGGSTWGRVERELRLQLKNSGQIWVTMMIDYYQLPKDTPGFDAIAKNPRKPTNAAAQIQNCIAEQIGDQRLIPFLTLHEFEALLFCNPEAVGIYFDSLKLTKDLEQIKNRHETPEHINGGKDTNPASQLNGLLQKHLSQGYAKRKDGPTLAQNIGLESMAKACPHFKGWLDRLRGI